MADTIKIDGYTYDNFTHYNIGDANSIEELDNANGTVIPDRFISIGRMINCIGTIIPDTIISKAETLMTKMQKDYTKDLSRKKAKQKAADVPQLSLLFE